MKSMLAASAALLCVILMTTGALAQPEAKAPLAPTTTYIIRVRVGDGLTQDIQIALGQAFHVTTTLDQTQWTIGGQAQPVQDKDNMQLDLSVERQQTGPGNAMSRQSLHTQFETLPDGHEMTVGNFNGVASVVASLRPNATAAK